MRTTSEGRALLREWRHSYILGASRSGKTNFMTLLASFQLNQAIVVLDPHGELSLNVASMAPKDRLIYVDKDHPFCINCLTRSGYNLSEKADELVGFVNASASKMNPYKVTVKMFRILRSALEVFDEKQMNLEYLAEFLDSPEVRKKHFRNKMRTLFWKEFEYKGVKYDQTRMSAERITDRLSLLYKDQNLCKFVVKPDEFDLFDIAKNKKIVVFNLSGLFDEQINYLGNLITYAIRSYIVKAPLNNHPVAIYIDEFHKFVNPSFENALTESLKKNLTFVFSHHNHSQISRELLDIVITNSDLICCLRLGDTEKRRMAPEYGIKISDFDYPKYHAYLLIDNEPHFVKTIHKKVQPYTPPPSIPKEKVNFLRDDIIKT